MLCKIFCDAPGGKTPDWREEYKMSAEKKKTTIGDLAVNPRNPRKITHRKSEMLGKSMVEFGDLSGIVYNVCTKRLIGGHQRTKHFDPSWPITKKNHKDKTGTVALGEIKTPFGVWAYREVDWPEEKENLANIAANQHGGEFNDLKLRDILSNYNDIDIDLIGFEDNEIDDLFLENIQELEYKEIELKPYKMTHVLLSFPPEKLIKIQEYLERIKEIEGIEYEQNSN